MSSKENEMQDGPAAPGEQDHQFIETTLEPNCDTLSSTLLKESMNRDDEGAFVASNTENNDLSWIPYAVNLFENLMCEQGDVAPMEEEGATEEEKQLESIDETGEVAATTSGWYSAGSSDGGIDGYIDPSLIVVHTMPQGGELNSFDSLLNASPVPDVGVSPGNISDREKEIYDELVQLLQNSKSDHDGQTSTPPSIISEEKTVGVDGDVNEEETSEEEIDTSWNPIADEVMCTTERDTKEVEDSSKDDTKSNINKRSNLGEMGKLGEAKKAKKAKKA